MFKQLIQQLFGEDTNKQEPINYDEQKARLRNTYKGETASYNYAKVNHSIAGVIKVGHGCEQALWKNESNEHDRVIEIAKATGFTPVFVDTNSDQAGFSSTTNLKFWMRGGAAEGDVENYRAS